jgi:large subunit ribosomal protein L25
MAGELILRAQPRTVLGKKVKQLRRAGGIPGVVYGPVVPETISVTVDRRDFDKFYTANGHSTLFTLEWDGGRQPVFIREVQVDPVKYTPLHIDFFAPNLRKELTATVPVVLHHPNEAAEGVLTTSRTEIEVRGLPANIPHQVDAEISGLVAVGDALRVSDLTLPPGIEAVTAEDELIAILSPETVPTAEEVEEAEAAEAEAAEAQAAAGEDAPDAVPETEGSTTSGTETDA